MTLVRPVGDFGISAVATSCIPSKNDPLTIDLSRCTFVRPAGLVFMGVTIEAASAQGRPSQLVFHERSDVAKYIDRMGLRRIAEECSVATSQFPNVRHHPAEDRFVELTRFSSSGYELIDAIVSSLSARARGLVADWKSLGDAVFELGVNVEQHAGSTGLVAVQNYPRLGLVEFAVGDFGVGVRSSLTEGGYTLADDAEAIRLAVETTASRFQPTDSYRGKGLYRLREQLTGDRLRGYIVVQSGRHQVTWRHDDDAMSRQLNYNLRGTLAFGQLKTH